MKLVEEYAPEYGLNLTLEALGLNKGTWHYRKQMYRSYSQKHALLRDPLMKIAREHPEYGYRKVTSELRESGWKTNHKVVQRLQREWGLPVVRSVRRPRQSAIRDAIRQLGDRINLVMDLDEIEILQVLYTDFTELLFDRGRKKVQLMPLIDHNSKLAVGWAIGPSANTDLALEAWQRTRDRLLRFGVDPSALIVHHDQDPVYTSHAWLQQLRIEDQARVSFSLNGARGNTRMESFNGHFKQENASIFWEQKNLLGMTKVVESRMQYYNDIRRHASLGNISPSNYLEKYGY